MKKIVHMSKYVSKKQSLWDQFPKNEGERLQIMIKLTKKAMNKTGYRQYLVDQLARLEIRLKTWENSNSK